MKKTKKYIIIFIIFILFIFSKNTKVYGATVSLNQNGYMETYVSGMFDYQYALNVLSLVNVERQNQGLAPLTLDKDLMESAMQRAAELVVSFSHTRPNGESCFTAVKNHHGGLGENIAWGQPNPEFVMWTWMNSPGHRSNILGNYKSIGIGCFYCNGSYNWVQIFSTENGNGSVSSNRVNGTKAVEVPISNFKTYVNSRSSYQLEVGKDTCLNCKCDYNGQTYDLTNSNITFTVSDPSIATISNGRIKGLKTGTVTVTAKIGKNTATSTVNVIPKSFSVYYQTHIQEIGWQEYQKNGETSGTTGHALRLEGIKIHMEDMPTSGNIEYCTHVQNIGWQGYVKNGSMSGTSGRALRLEAIKIKLTGAISNQYDIYYRVHCENFGWLGWAKNGESAGSEGYGYRLEGIEIKLVKKGGSAPGSVNNRFRPNFKYKTHVQDIGWQDFVNYGQVSGTTGRALRLEGIILSLSNSEVPGSIEYCTHVQDIGWQDYVKNGAMSGTSGRALRLEAIKIRLTGEMANKYDIYYRVHCQNFGWMGWAKNGESAGSAGYSYRLEGIEIQLVEKGGSAPGSTANSFIQG